MRKIFFLLFLQSIIPAVFADPAPGIEPRTDGGFEGAENASSEKSLNLTDMDADDFASPYLETREYDESGRLEIAAAYQDGIELYKDRYYYTSSGAIRCVERLYADGRSERASVISAHGALLRISHSSRPADGSGGSLEERAYDGLSRLKEKISVEAGEVAALETYEYEAENALPGSVLFSARGERTIARFTPEGYISSVVVTGGEADSDQISRSDYTYDEHGKLLRKRTVASDIAKEYVYSYDQNGALQSESFIQNGSHVSRIDYYPEGRRLESFYKDGEPVLRIFFENGKKQREEVVRNGVVIKERNLNETQ